ncbi:MAG TPA: hypothetical protein VIC30_07150 [Orrella sp.]
MLPTTYAIKSALTSPKFGKAFAKGCGGQLVYHDKLPAEGSIAMFGHPDLVRMLYEAQDQGRDWYYGDKAYFGREAYYRATKNAYMHNAVGEPDYKRLSKIGIKSQPWRNGSYILLCPQSPLFFAMQGKNRNEWIYSVTKELKKHTNRKVRVRETKKSPGTESAFRKSLDDVWAVVVHSSMAGTQAAMHGVPCFATDPDCTSAAFGSTDLSLIESPVKPDNRDEMAAVLAANQWTLDEIASGMAWEHIK